MRRKTNLTLAKALILVAMVFMLPSCGSGLVGTWETTELKETPKGGSTTTMVAGIDHFNTFVIVMNIDNTFKSSTVERGNQTVETGTWSVSGHNITFTYSPSDSMTGTYSISGNTLTIKYSEDENGVSTTEVYARTRGGIPKAKEKVARKSSPNIDGIYHLTYKLEKLPRERSLELKLVSGRVYMSMMGGSMRTEEVGKYKVVGNKITDASGRTEILTLEDDGSLTIPNLPKEFRFMTGGFSKRNFTDNGNGTVTDKVTGLMWQQEDDVEREWGDANTYCEDLSLAGYNDWRLPDMEELKSIVDNDKRNPAIDMTYFSNTNSSGYWSSTTNESSTGDTGDAWSVDFSYGSVYSDFKSLSYYVRCVRGRPVR